MRRIILLIGLCIFPCLPAHADLDKGTQSPQIVRVAVTRDARELSLMIEGRYVLRNPADGQVLQKASHLPRSTIRLLDRGIMIGLKVYAVKRIIIEPNRDATIVLNNRRFRGDVAIIRSVSNRLTAVNYIDIENYIKGVLYHEVSHHWPMEALKAQAVAARTYALYSLKNKTVYDYDLTNDIYSQVYGGKNSERYRTGLAVTHTSGLVLAYGNKIMPAYFHATCAGMTEEARELWNIDIPPLRGVPCLFCKDSPHYTWKKNLRLKDMQQVLNRKRLKMGLIKDLMVVDRNRSGRINRIKITGHKGEELIISGKDFRELMGPNTVRSNNYEIQMKGYYVDLIGKGWGHGVGLCQWGAFGMARQQFNFRQILAYYYPGADLVDYHTVMPPEPSSARAPAQPLNDPRPSKEPR